MFVAVTDLMTKHQGHHPCSFHGAAVGNVCANSPSPECPEISNTLETSGDSDRQPGNGTMLVKLERDRTPSLPMCDSFTEGTAQNCCAEDLMTVDDARCYSATRVGSVHSSMLQDPCSEHSVAAHEAQQEVKQNGVKQNGVKQNGLKQESSTEGKRNPVVTSRFETTPIAQKSFPVGLKSTPDTFPNATLAKARGNCPFQIQTLDLYPSGQCFYLQQELRGKDSDYKGMVRSITTRRLNGSIGCSTRLKISRVQKLRPTSAGSVPEAQAGHARTNVNGITTDDSICRGIKSILGCDFDEAGAAAPTKLQEPIASKPSHLNTCSIDCSPRLGVRCSEHREAAFSFCTFRWKLLCATCLRNYDDLSWVKPLYLAFEHLLLELKKMQDYIGTCIRLLFGSGRKVLTESHELWGKDHAERQGEATQEIRESTNAIGVTFDLLEFTEKLLGALCRRDLGKNLLRICEGGLKPLLDKVLHIAREVVMEPYMLDLCRDTASSCMALFDDAEAIERHNEVKYLAPLPGTPSVPTSDPDVHWEDRGDCEQTRDSTGKEPVWGVAIREVKHDGSELVRCHPAPNPQIVLMEKLREFSQSFEIDYKSSSLPLWSLVSEVKKGSVTDCFDDASLVFGKHEKDEHLSDVFTRPASSASKWKLDRQLGVPCAGDEKPAHITVLHWMESGLVVGVDEANGCLKAFDLSSSKTFKFMEGTSPIGLCSAGSAKVMVSCRGRRLAVYKVCRRYRRLVKDIKTGRQYYGLVSIPQTKMVAASCPSTRSVHLLRYNGREKVRLRAVDFVSGPYMIGATKDGELLAVDRPQGSRTTIVCIGLDDQVKWKYPVSSTLKHVTCSQLVGAENGDIYFAVQNDSLVYRLQRTERGWIDGPVSNSGKAIDFQHPSALAFTEKGHMIVPRNVPIGEGETTTYRTVSVDVYTQWSQSTPDTAGITDLGAGGDGSLYVFSREVGGKKIA